MGEHRLIYAESAKKAIGDISLTVEGQRGYAEFLKAVFKKLYPAMSQRIDELPTIAPEAFPIVTELRAKLARYEKAEQEGRLIEFPCKIGDTVFGIKRLKTADGTLNDLLLSGNVICFKELEGKRLCVVSIKEHFGYPTQWDIEDFGKTVFLTREDAEAVLKERRGTNYAE